MTNEEWLVDQCNRLKYGECHTLACLKRGGYERGDLKTMDPNKSTCHAYEIHQQLKAAESTEQK